MKVFVHSDEHMHTFSDLDFQTLFGIPITLSHTERLSSWRRPQDVAESFRNTKYVGWDLFQITISKVKSGFFKIMVVKLSLVSAVANISASLMNGSS